MGEIWAIIGALALFLFGYVLGLADKIEKRKNLDSELFSWACPQCNFKLETNDEKRANVIKEHHEKRSHPDA